MCISKSQRLSPFASPFFPSWALAHLHPQLNLPLPPPLLRQSPLPFQPWLSAPPQTPSWVQPPVRGFSFPYFDYYSPFYCSPPPFLPLSTYVYSPTSPSVAATAAVAASTATGAQDVIEAEALGEWVEGGFEVTETKKNEGGLEDFYPSFLQSLPLLSTPTNVYSSTTPSAADSAATGAKYAIEAMAKRLESGFEVIDAKKKEAGLDIIGAKKGQVNGFKKRHFSGACKGLQRKFLGGQKRMQHWMPSSDHGGNDPSLLLPNKRKSDPPRFHGLDRKFSESSSVMMRNIPNKLREKLIELLDKHCAEENAKIGLRSKCVLSAYDFVYVPIDFSSGVNKGYAFVNFTSKAAAGRFKTFFSGYKWSLFGSRKICKIDYAKIQGREGLVWHFRDTKFPCDKEEYLPVQFSPPRNGSSQFPPPSTVGCLLGRRKDAPCQLLDEPK